MIFQKSEKYSLARQSNLWPIAAAVFRISLLIILSTGLILFSYSCVTPSTRCLLVDNPTAENMIIYLDDVPWYTVGWNNKATPDNRLSIGYGWDYKIQVRNTQSELFYTKRLKCEEFTKNQMTITIPASPKIRVYNPNHERVIICVNDNPIDIIRERFGLYITSIGLPENTDGSFSKYVIEALDSQGNVLFSNEFTWRALSQANWQLNLPHFKDTSFAITVKNLFDETLEIYINGQLTGDIASNTEKRFSGLIALPRLEPRPDLNILWEKYLIEAKNISGDTVYSKDFNGVDAELNDVLPIVISPVP